MSGILSIFKNILPPQPPFPHTNNQIFHRVAANGLCRFVSTGELQECPSSLVDDDPPSQALLVPETELSMLSRSTNPLGTWIQRLQRVSSNGVVLGGKKGVGIESDGRIS